MVNQQREVLTTLRQCLEEHFSDIELVEKNGFVFLCFSPCLFTDNTGLVYMEVCLIDYSEAITIAQIYSTMLLEPGPGIDVLRKRLGEWNFNSLTGAYGIYEKQGQLYHKQNIAVVNDAAIDDKVDFIFSGICIAMDEMARRFADAVAIVDKDLAESDFDQKKE